MSKIDRLNILGIRSFPQGRGETITFYTPLTLIVGTNGSGKTTIVECLKYATTGIQPPNTKGGAFIHDPKLSGEKEIMAQVKMQFRNTTGARMVVTRSLQLTIKKTTRTMKTLEGSLLIDRNGEKHTMSSRVAELDQIMPQSLGVGPAVLDNVIFCHQDESLWPLSEPSALKKKFDEIFEAQKYTKAVDNIKLIRKKHNEELGKYKILEQHAKQDRDRAADARKKSERLSDEIEDLRGECQELQQKIDESSAKADRLWKDAENYARIIGALEGKRIEANGKQNIINNLRKHLKEVNESDEWLRRTLEQFKATVSRDEDERDNKKLTWLEWKDEIANLTQKNNSKLAEMGKHEQDKEEYERQLQRRKTMIKDAAARHQQRGYDDLEDDALVDEFLYKIKKLLKDQNSALERARTKADGEKQAALSSINRHTERKGALQDSKNTHRQQIADVDRQTREYQRKVDHIKIDEGSKAIIESRIEDVGTKLENAQRSSQTANWDQKIKEAGLQLRSQEDEASHLNDKLVQSTKRAGDVARLAHLMQELKEKKRSQETLTNAHGDRIRELISQDWTSTTIEGVHREALAEAARELSVAERERDHIGREIEQIQFKQKNIRDEITQKTEEAKQEKAVVCKTIQGEIDEYTEALELAQRQVDEARDHAKGLGGLADYFQTCLKTIDTSKPVCRTCQRGFKGPDDQALVNMKRRLESLIRKADFQTKEADLPAAEEDFKRIQDAGSHLANYKKLTDEQIPILEKDYKSLGLQKDALNAKLEQHDKIVEQRQIEHRNLEQISRTVSSITKSEADIAAFNTQIEELSAKQSQQGNIQTLEDIQDEITSINEKIRGTKASITQLSSDQLESRNMVHELELELRDLKNDLGVTSAQLEKKAGLLARVEEFKALIQKHRNAIDKADKDIEDLDPQISSAQAKFDDITQRWGVQLADLARDVTQLSETVNGLNLLNNQIAGYVDRGGPNQLTIVRRDIEAIEKGIKKATDAQAQLTKEIHQVEERLRDSENTKRQYADNLAYRQESQALEQLKEEINELASRNAEVDRDRFQEQSRQASKQHQAYSVKREGKLGEMKSKDMQLQELIRDFKTDFVDAPTRYLEAHVRVATTKAAVADLQVYGSALDNAIMKFHGIKMEQVNEIIGDLWTKTYKGSDVDKIMIRSDPEAGAASGGTRGRSYNYRTVMVKQGVEMDMRGRCSAGQKVLASIIIRLALADVFSQDCGLIALDEPTTNLDHANIVSLAQSLHDIIQERRKQANFQLIIITHDEEFLRAMNCGDFTDYYYRVSRDQRADSIIERQDIGEVER